MNQAFPWTHNRRLNLYVTHFREVFDQRVQKLSIDAGFTCPNRDGSIAKGGCTFCDNEAFRPSYCLPTKSITQQIAEGKDFHRIRYRRAMKYLAYFQAYSNTYAPLEVLKSRYEEALNQPDVVGLVIGTRPDCLDDAKLEYLAQLSRQSYLVLELGLETCKDSTLERINRGHSFADSCRAIEAAAQKGIHVGTHLILGLPTESREDGFRAIEELNRLPIYSVKFHQLQFFKGTKILEWMRESHWDIAYRGFEEYLDFMIDLLEHLNPQIFIERVSGEVPPRFLEVVPENPNNWAALRADQVLQRLEKRMEERQTYQGRLF